MAFVSYSAERRLRVNVNDPNTGHDEQFVSSSSSQSKVQGPSHQLKSSHQSVQPFVQHWCAQSCQSRELASLQSFVSVDTFK